MKTQEELNTLKEEVETLNKKLAELTKEELEQISGGETWWPVELARATGENTRWKTHNGVDIESSVSGKAQMDAWDLIFK